ncbi:MAG TPA: phosphatidylglycerol lysyltransferase domain-containing protein [Spirochaetota bacterium]
MNCLNAARLPFSEFSFTNLYLFRDVHDYYISGTECRILIDGITRDHVHYAMPLFDISLIGGEELEKIIRDNGVLFPVHESQLHLFSPDKYEWSYSHDDSDYLFTRDKLIHYPGRNLHKKRNLLKQFLEGYEWRSEPLTSERSADAQKILSDWQKGTGLADSETDYLSCHEALNHIESFNLTGCVIYVEDALAGFVLGEMISPNVFALHFAKCNTRFKGIYQFIYNHYAKELSPECEWINFEQDLGIPALRQAKETYEPDMMAHKYRVKLKD